MSSPLVKVDPQSLDALFSADPLGWSDADLDRLIAEERRARENWAKAESTGTTRSASAKLKTPGTAIKSIKDLGL